MLPFDGLSFSGYSGWNCGSSSWTMLPPVLFWILLRCWPSIPGNLCCTPCRCLTYVFTHLLFILPTTIPPALMSNSLPGLVTQYIRVFFLLYIEGLYEKIKQEGIRNIKECAGKQPPPEPWWTYCSYILKRKKDYHWLLSLLYFGCLLWLDFMYWYLEVMPPYLTLSWRAWGW